MEGKLALEISSWRKLTQTKTTPSTFFHIEFSILSTIFTERKIFEVFTSRIQEFIVSRKVLRFATNKKRDNVKAKKLPFDLRNLLVPRFSHKTG